MYLSLKRTLDIIISVIGFIPMAVVYVVLFVIKLFTERNRKIIYIQERVGKNGKPFRMYKFRTMSDDADEKLAEILKEKNCSKEWDEHQKLSNDSRVTGIGVFLRKHSLDELPQFINSFKGDMSVIGPRPLLKGELEAHGGDEKLYQSIKPGITGWWACSGSSDMSYSKRLDMEYYYINNMSFKTDLLCFIRTVKVMLTGTKKNV